MPQQKSTSTINHEWTITRFHLSASVSGSQWCSCCLAVTVSWLTGTLEYSRAIFNVMGTHCVLFPRWQVKTSTSRSSIRSFLWRKGSDKKTQLSASFKTNAVILQEISVFALFSALLCRFEWVRPRWKNMTSPSTHQSEFCSIWFGGVFGQWSRFNFWAFSSY